MRVLLAALLVLLPLKAGATGEHGKGDFTKHKSSTIPAV